MAFKLSSAVSKKPKQPKKQPPPSKLLQQESEPVPEPIEMAPKIEYACTEASHPRLQELEQMLHKDGVPLDKLKDSFILVSQQVLKHPELVEVMAAPEIGLVTRAAERILDVKLAMPSTKKKAAAKPKTTKAKLNAMAKEAAAAVEEEGEDWSDL